MPDTPPFPPLIAALIALSTVYLGLENIVQAARPHGAGERRHGDDLNRRWKLAFGFGLLHGYAYATALREMLQYAGEHLLTALMAFNAGVGIAQIALLVVFVPALGLVLRRVVADWLGIIILSTFATAWDWMLERGKQLARFPMPSFDATFPADAMTAVLAALMLTGGVWLASGWLGRWIKPDRMPPARDLAAHTQASGAESD